MKYPKRSQYKYAKSQYRVRNWSEYEAGLRKRGDLTLWFSDDLLATGSLRLIRDPELRTKLITYYDETDAKWLRIDRRRTGYPQAMYRLNPQGWQRPAFESVFSDLVKQTVDSLQTPKLVNLLNAEQTLSGFQRSMMLQSLDLVVDLLTDIRTQRE